MEGTTRSSPYRKILLQVHLGNSNMKKKVRSILWSIRKKRLIMCRFFLMWIMLIIIIVEMQFTLSLKMGII